MPPLPKNDQHAADFERDTRKVFVASQQVSEIASDRLEPRVGSLNSILSLATKSQNPAMSGAQLQSCADVITSAI